MYYTRKNPLRKVTEDSEEVITARSGVQRKLHKALLRYHDPAGHDIIREHLREIGRTDLIGNSPQHLIPREPPAHLQRRGNAAIGTDFVHAIKSGKPGARTGAPQRASIARPASRPTPAAKPRGKR
jgi:hypothetical protein